MNTKANSSTPDGTSGDVARTTPTSPAERQTPAISIHRLPCKCCRSVNTYRAHSEASREVPGARPAERRQVVRWRREPEATRSFIHQVLEHAFQRIVVRVDLLDSIPSSSDSAGKRP